MRFGGLEQAVSERVGLWSYLIGLGGCATCNMLWLVARSLFRREKAYVPWVLTLVGRSGT